jgi:Protein of unknown function (DUF3313)
MQPNPNRRDSILLGVCAVIALVCPVQVGADTPPQTDKDGLVLKTQTKQRLIYVRPGATLAPYDRVALLDCYVEFQKDWQKEYNESKIGLAGRVSDSDVERMKQGLAAEFKKVFSRELENGGYKIVDVAAPDVLVLRPALVNVIVTAPDILTPGINATVVRSAGQMTLYLEFWDSATNTIIGRVLDAQADNSPFAQAANRVSNAAAADRILQAWAVELRKHLDAIRGQAPQAAPASAVPTADGESLPAT